ncbi:MAG: isocitrate lyase/phosphoenolpyruvate mutase family protein [Beijerinckiaceae bacterium]|nr:isocitrate lyase/phosphoenolpyruvate mutase family protein [Beijerinckiaceae bacterium]
MEQVAQIESKHLAARLARGEGVVAPGVFDALTSHIAAAAGFDTLYLSGAALAYTRLGQPDVGLVSVSELIDTTALIRDRVDCALVVDGDTGFGNALNVQRTIRALERAGATAIQLEDQTFPKRCGHLAGKNLVPVSEMIGKLKAAVDARHGENTLIIGRTDAIAVEGFDRAIERARLYAEAGADILFVEAPNSRDELSAMVRELQGVAPLMGNMVEGGRTPLHSAAEMHALGFGLVIFPGGIVRALARSARDYYASLKTHGDNGPFRERMFDFNELNAVLGTDALMRKAATYE